MRWVKAPLIAIALLAPLAVAQRLYYIPLLPDRVGGEDKRDFVSGSAQLWVVGICFFVFAVLGNVWPIRFFPTGCWWIPNRRFWMSSPENRARLSMIYVNYLLWLFAAVIGLGIGLTQATVQDAGLAQWWLFFATAVAFIVFCFVRYGIWMSRLIYGDKVPQESP